MRVFVGASGGGRTSEVTGHNVPTIEYATLNLDKRNNLMAAQPVFKEFDADEVIQRKEAHAGDLRSKLTLAWLWRRQKEERGFSAHACSYGSNRIGHVLLSLSFALFRGNTTCNDVRKVVEESVLACL